MYLNDTCFRNQYLLIMCSVMIQEINSMCIFYIFLVKWFLYITSVVSEFWISLLYWLVRKKKWGKKIDYKEKLKSYFCRFTYCLHILKCETSLNDYIHVGISSYLNQRDHPIDQIIQGDVQRLKCFNPIVWGSCGGNGHNKKIK